MGHNAFTTGGRTDTCCGDFTNCPHRVDIENVQPARLALHAKVQCLCVPACVWRGYKRYVPKEYGCKSCAIKSNLSMYDLRLF